MPKRLSSPTTFDDKFLLPPLWLGIGLCLYLVVFGPLGVKVFFGPLDVDNVAPLTFVTVWLSVLTYLALRYCYPLKQVSLAGTTLLVSNFFREIEVPLHDVASVTKGEMFRKVVVTVRFKCRTEFGEEVVFIPEAGHLFGEVGGAKDLLDAAERLP